MADVVYLRSYDDRSRDDAETRKVLDATAELLREVPFVDLTMRAIGKRAGVGVGAVRAHFWSKDAIVAEIYLDRLRAVPLNVDVAQGAQERIAIQFSQLVMLLADEPGLAAACSSALVSSDPSVRSVRERIHAEYHRRVRINWALRWPPRAPAGLVTCRAATTRRSISQGASTSSQRHCVARSAKPRSEHPQHESYEVFTLALAHCGP